MDTELYEQSMDNLRSLHIYYYAITAIHGRASLRMTRIDILHLSDLLIEPIRLPFRAYTFTITHEHESFANPSLNI